MGIVNTERWRDKKVKMYRDRDRCRFFLPARWWPKCTRKSAEWTERAPRQLRGKRARPRQQPRALDHLASLLIYLLRKSNAAGRSDNMQMRCKRAEPWEEGWLSRQCCHGDSQWCATTEHKQRRGGGESDAQRSVGSVWDVMKLGQGQDEGGQRKRERERVRESRNEGEA